jgi:hypothetical protein
MEHLKVYIYLTFEFTVLLAIILFYRASNYSRAFLTTVFLLVVIQSFLGLSGFYRVSKAMPPRFPLLVAPAMIILCALFITNKGRLFLASLNIKQLTIFHSIRILVEIVLYWLFLQKAVPALLTFEGRNFDIFSGLSAPLVYYFGFIKKRLNKFVMLAWNFICLGLLANVVFYSILSVPTPFQRFAFDQPNIASGYFPFVLLPAILVPMVLLSHIATIKQLIKN